MRKLYCVLLLLCVVSTAAYAQYGISTLYASGPSGSGRTGSCTPAMRTEGNMICSGAGPATSRAWAVFDLALLPSDAVIHSVEIGFNVETYTAGMGSTYDTYGYPGDISLLGTAAATYPAMVNPASTLLTTASYGFSVGTHVLASTAGSVAFVQGHLGNKISITFTTGTSRIYGFTDEAGLLDTAGAHAPYLLIKYSCGSMTGISAVASPSPVCLGSTVALIGTATGAGFYSWSGSSGLLSTTSTATDVPTAAETYTFSVTSATTGCSEDSVISVSVVPVPSAIISAAGPTAICAGGTVGLFVSSPPPGSTFQWYDGSTAIPGATNATYTASATGDYAAEVSNVAGCSAVSSSIPVLVLSVPTLTPTGTVNMCTAGGGSTVLTVNTGGATGLDYQWKKDGVNIPGATNDIYTATTSGSYVAQVSTAGGGCLTNSAATTVAISLYPNPPISYNGTVISTPNTYVNYQWFLNSVAITGATSYNYIPTVNGAYRVKATNVYGCAGYSSAVTIGNVGVAEQSVQNISIFPNPATNIVRVDAAYKVNVAITTVDGRTLAEQKDASEINIAHLPNGIYLVRVYDEQGQQLVVRKLIKE